MTFYELVYIASNPVFLFANYKLLQLCFAQKLCNSRKQIFLFFLYFGALSLVVFVPQLPILICAINLFFLGAISCCYQASFTKKVMSVSAIYALGITIEIISISSLGFFTKALTNAIDFEFIPILIFIRTIGVVVAHLLCRYKQKVVNDYDLPAVYYISFFAVLFGTLYLFVSQLDNPMLTTNRVLLASAILIAVNITMIIVDEKIYLGRIAEQEKKHFQEQAIAYEQQIEIINQSTQKIQFLKHDFQNHLMMITTLYQQQQNLELEDYINQLLKQSDNKKVAQSKHFVIDSIINFKLNSIDIPNLSYSLDLHVPTYLEISSYDLNVILSNLLDNALRACKMSTQKKLNIQIEYQLGNLMIVIQNTFEGQIIAKKGTLQSTKLAKRRHGLGLASVESIVNQHDGEMHISYTRDTFCVCIMLPC